MELTDPGAERNVLSCVWRSESAWLAGQDYITQDDFVNPLNRAIWIVVDNLHAKQVKIDPVTVFDKLAPVYQEELKEKLGGWVYLDHLNEIPVEPSNILHYGNQLRELAIRRKMVSVGEKIASIATTNTKEINKLQDEIESMVNDIPGLTKSEIVDLGSVGLDFLKKKMEHVTEIPGLPVGYTVLDQYIGGLREGDLAVFAGGPGAGKSTILLNIAKKIAVDDHLPVGWIATEHNPQEEYSRLLSITSRVEEQLIGNGTFSKINEYLEKVSNAEQQLRETSVKFLELPKFSVEMVERYTAKMVRNYGIKVLFFDYIRIPESGKGDKFWQEVGEFAYALKALGSKYKIPIVSAVQVNREGRKMIKFGDEMTVDYFALADDIGRACSIGIGIRELTKAELEDKTVDRDHSRVVELVKNRHGARGYKYHYTFHAETLTLEESYAID